MKKFYDTSSLLVGMDRVFEEHFIISYITILELEDIKTSAHKDNEIKAKARQLTRLLNKYPNMYTVCLDGKDEVVRRGLEITNDNIILASVSLHSPTVQFYTEDILQKLIAKRVFGLKVDSIADSINNEDQYTGYKEVWLNTDQEIDFYSKLNENTFSCCVNQYLVLKDMDGKTKDVLRWSGEKYTELYKKSIKTMSFGDKIKPKDIFQNMVVDSIMTNTLTAISGFAGSGKTLLSLVCAMNLIETNKYERLVILFNPTTARGASQLGFYSGDMISKAMQVNIGNILISKFGDRYAVDLLLQQNKLKLICMADQRGFQVNDDEILFVSECQNSSTDLLKLCLSRVSQGAKVIIEGDITSQVDHVSFENGQNGMRRAIEVLKGEDIFGYVELKNIYRSKVANLVDKM